MKMLWLFLRPNLSKAALLIISMLISSIVTTGAEATSKVTWQANRGFPLPFLTLFEYVQVGRCPQNTICIASNIQNFYPLALMLDILGWYLLSCAITSVYGAIKRQREAGKYGSEPDLIGSK